MYIHRYLLVKGAVAGAAALGLLIHIDARSQTHCSDATQELREVAAELHSDVDVGVA